jgi:hypothetical protein
VKNVKGVRVMRFFMGFTPLMSFMSRLFFFTYP